MFTVKKLILIRNFYKILLLRRCMKFWLDILVIYSDCDELFLVNTKKLANNNA